LGLWVTFSPLRRGVPFSAIAILIAYAIPLFMAAIVAEILAKATGAPTSWHIMGGLMAVNLTAFIANAVGGRRAA
jgi:ABC-type microcin C transport system permease subunit YejB